ncbi:universal stress protein [Pseudonocardia sp. H11422]|uniref:universal stress protein n=1 Tax=Pseudonocardia sp. H11422 TaxID=2835866 RepID=UPI001BDCC868|nr:universal stress protein [Pseudonocardia sp. H11422]
MTGGAPITVCADLSAAGAAAVRWAATEASRTGSELRVVVPDCAARPLSGRAAFTATLGTVRGVDPDLSVRAEATGAPAGAALRALSAASSLVVAPGGAAGLRRIVADTHCPVVFVPMMPRDPPDGHDGVPVVLGAATWTGEAAVELAFRAAAARAAPLYAVRAWSDPRIDLGRILPSRLARWDATVERIRRELGMALAAAAAVHPGVRVELLVVEDRPAEFLLALSQRAQLLVVGRSLRAVLFAGIAGSPAEALARRAGCPVMVVPGADNLDVSRRRAAAPRPVAGYAG